MRRTFLTFCVLCLCLAAGAAWAASERTAVYMTVGGPLEVVRDGADFKVLWAVASSTSRPGRPSPCSPT